MHRSWAASVCPTAQMSSVALDSDCAAYCKAVMAIEPMQEWLQGAQAEPDEVVELDVEF